MAEEYQDNLSALPEVPCTATVLAAVTAAAPMVNTKRQLLQPEHDVASHDMVCIDQYLEKLLSRIRR